MTSGEVVAGESASPAWWLVVDAEHGRDQTIAGPFPDRAEAVWAARGYEWSGLGHVWPVHGVRRADGVLHRRPSPQELAWLAHLGAQLNRLPDDWDTEIPDDDPLITLVVMVAAALSEAGLPLYTADGPGSDVGGACLNPEPGLPGIVTRGRQHDRMSVDHVHGATAAEVVQRVMNVALADVIRLRGFQVDALGDSAGYVVRTGI